MFSLTPLEAAKKIDKDFGFNLSNEDNNYKELSKEWIQDKKLLESFNVWEQNYFITICEKIKFLEDVAKFLKLKEDRIFSDEHATVTNELQLAEYHWDILFNGDSLDKYKLCTETLRREYKI